MLVCLLLGAAHAVDGAAHETCVPQFGKESRPVVIAKSGDGLSTPRDLQFHPANGELWVASADAGGDASGNYIIRNPGTPEQTTTLLQDRIPFHYQDNMAAFTFDKAGKVLMSCQESENRYLGLAAGPNWFQGPTAFELYPCDGGYGRLNADGSCDVMTVSHSGEICTGDDCYIIHSDMLHESPLCMGMAHDPGAVTGTTGFNQINGRTPGHIVWYHDGMRGKLMRFDFDSLHGTEIIDHRFANIRRYVDVDVKRRPGVPGHMVVDEAARVLYVADTGNKRVLRVNADSGRFLRGAQCVPDECYPTNLNHTCADTQQMFLTREACEAGNCGTCSRDTSAKYECYAGHCKSGVCAGADGFGCYTIYTETGDMFEYELWGCTDYDIFTTELESPSGIALDGRGRVFVSDYDSGVIVAFDQTGTKLAEHHVGKGVSGLEISCPEAGECTLWYVNIDSKEVLKLHVDDPCVASGTLPPVPSITRVSTGYEAQTCDRGDADRTRPDFISRHGEGYNNRMIVHHAYGKACEGVALGEVPEGTGDAEQALCPDRTDCSDMNYDLLVMAGFFCHPCLNNPCANEGVCTNLARVGYTCDCAATGHSGERCEIPPTTCPAFPRPDMGSIVPPSCATGPNYPGQACLLQCPGTMQPVRPAGAPATADLVAACGDEGAWSGGGMVCACASGRFGEGCATVLAPAVSAEVRATPATGALLELTSGDSLRVPPNALAQDTEITMAVYDVEGLEVVSGGATGALRSHVTELTPRGLALATPATLSLQHSGAQTASNLAVFFWNDADNAWEEVEGSTVDGAAISAPISHLSRCAVLEKAPPAVVVADDDDDGLSVGAIVGIVVGCVAGIALLGAVFYYVSTSQKPAVAASEAVKKGSPAPSQPAGVVFAGSNFPSNSHPEQPQQA